MLYHHCICDDDDGVRWKVPFEENGEKSCRLHNEDYGGIHKNSISFILKIQFKVIHTIQKELFMT